MSREAGVETANVVFKRRAAAMYWHSLALAAVLHFMLFALWPARSVADVWPDREDTVLLEIPDIEIPRPPEEIRRPLEPVPVLTDEIDPPSHDWSSRWDKVEVAPPVGAPPADELRDAAWITPSMVKPTLLNGSAVERALERTYPRILREAGIGGTVMMHFLIDTDGTVLAREIARSSGYDALDEAAAEVAAVMQFSPALNRSSPVRVWVAIPVVFRTR